MDNAIVLVIGNFRFRYWLRPKFRFQYQFRFRFNPIFRFRQKFRFKIQPKIKIFRLFLTKLTLAKIRKLKKNGTVSVSVRSEFRFRYRYRFSLSVQTEQKFWYLGFGSNIGFGRSLYSTFQNKIFEELKPRTT